MPLPLRAAKPVDMAVYETTTCCAYRVTPQNGDLAFFSASDHKMDVGDHTQITMYFYEQVDSPQAAVPFRRPKRGCQA